MKLLAKQHVGGMSKRAVATVVISQIANDVQRVVQKPKKSKKIGKKRSLAQKVKKKYTTEEIR